MNLRLISTTGAMLFASTLGACGAQQQDPQCMVGKGSFATVYTPKPGQDESLACARLKPERVGLEKYFNQDPNGRDSVALRTGQIGDELAHKDTLIDPDAPNQPNSVGELKTDAPGPDNFCEVSTLNPARLESRYGGVSKASVSLTYEWSNLRIYSTPQIPGTQFTADLRYTKNGCTAEFSVKGIWPVVSCATSGKPDDTKCDPNPDPSVGRVRGSGINPIFPVKCDPEALICVLTGEVPSDKP
ncbi:hypothetical protein [Archangium sp.]|uniref:hypothetical protein n=1 Tax=Archangium sp. TaxID=1872627 RepID=UPI002D42663C|nr:hypothetical protein [Archangium sp.]HYO53306.1 hypothetical protein [Archangium sp.]